MSALRTAPHHDYSAVISVLRPLVLDRSKKGLHSRVEETISVRLRQFQSLGGDLRRAFLLFNGRIKRR
jgi:hypothetical protein